MTWFQTLWASWRFRITLPATTEKLKRFADLPAPILRKVED